MNDVWALIPVKSLERSKSRLNSVLNPQECAMLSRAMFMDVLDALNDAEGISNIAVLTNDEDVAGLASQLGHLVIADQSEGELCDGLNAAAKQLAELGADGVLILPGDLPTVTAADIESLLAKHEGGLSLCPAIRDGGTNALLCSPPDALPFQFGQDSARKHLELAEISGIKTNRLPMHAFFRDIDTPEDLSWLARQGVGGNTSRFLQRSGINARLKPGLSGASA
jgi:2-phospho-L-lactate guanylyltransferase